ncbi:uncharacterized protein LOC130945055 [Arachis stenosperma]|uniref:uncharacterized protein LOC130945055 n=1 Tax=Arachis stenosperma TaxID=217475 RepID=UPI0025ABAC76|nr:uncharacterized protein LOC130945055 [Arachis stenosperma]
MGGKGGCCVTRYATGPYDMSKMEKIMLRFRPIAPKPVAGAAGSDGSSSESGDVFSRSAGRAAKRKYTKGGSGSNRRRRKTAASASAKVSPLSPAVTLPLLPETPDPKEDILPVVKEDAVPVSWFGFGESTSPAKGSVVVLTVECVTDTWQKERGSSNEETMRVKLSQDTCPGFISDGYGNVMWTNGAFNGMVGGSGCDEGKGRVWLVTNVVSAAVASAPYCGGFTCRVRVQREDSNTDLTVPCDVWRIIDGSGFAWRLDVNAALTLSLAL